MSNQLEKEFEGILKRKEKGEEGSYTTYLFNNGKEKILKKIGEESTEVIIASMKDDKEELICEICDLTYHVLVLMAEQNISMEDIGSELKKRRDKTKNFKGERKAIENI